MNKYIIKAAKHSNDDRFCFKEATEHLYFFAAGSKDLQRTIRCLTPPGYHVGSVKNLSRILRSGEAEMMNPLLRTTMFEIRQIKHSPIVEYEIEFTNSGGHKHKLKVISPESWNI